MPYEEEKHCFVDFVQRKQHWSHKSFEEIRTTLGATGIERQLEQSLGRNKIDRGSLWEGCLVDGKYVIVYSRGETLVVCFQQIDGSEAIVQENLHFPIHYITISNNLGVVQIFVGSSTGTLKHLHFYLDQSRLQPTFQTIVDRDVFTVVPCSFHQHSHRPHYFWTIGNNAIKFNTLVESTVDPTIVYHLPSQRTFVTAQGIFDERDGSHGLAVHYLADSGNELCTLMFDAVPAMLYTEQSYRENKKICDVKNVAYTISPIRSQSGMMSNIIRRQSDSICSVITSRVIHDYEIDYEFVETSLQNSQANFTWIVHTLHTNGVINKVQFSTKQHELRNKLEMHGESLLSSSATAQDFESFKLVFIDKHEVHSFFPHSSHAFESKAITHTQPDHSVSIFSACVDAKLCLVSRKKSVFRDVKANDEFHRRVVIMEALVALQLSDVIGKALERKDSSAFNERYFVADVQSLFKWVVDLLNQTLGQWKFVLESKTVPLLCQRTFSPEFELNTSMAVLLMHHELVTASMALQTIVGSLLNRKKAIMDHPSLHHRHQNLMQVPLTYDLVLQSLVELFLLSQETEVLLKTVKFHVHMVEDVAITLSMFDASRMDNSKTIAQENVPLRKHLHENMRGVLPEYMCSDQLLFDWYVHPLLPDFLQSVKFYEWKYDEICDKVSNLLMLPHAVVHKQSASLTSRQTGYDQKTLQQLADKLFHDYHNAVRAVLYVLLDCNHTSNVLLQSQIIDVNSQLELDIPLISSLVQFDRESIEYIQAAAFIDSGYHNVLEPAIKKFCFSTGINYLEINGFILPLIQRLLTSGHQGHAHVFIRALAVRDHQILSTKEGAVAVAIAQPFNDRENSWKATWLSAKKCVANVKPAVDAFQASTDITHFITVWTIRHGVLSELLNHALDLGEIEVVIASLGALVNQDLQDRRSPSAAIDTMFAFLLKNFRIEDAKKLHQVHQKVIGNVIDDSISDREALLRGMAKIDLPSRSDYEMKLNLARVKTCFK